MTRREALDLTGHARERRRLGEDSIDAKLTVAELATRFLASRATTRLSTQSHYKLVCAIYLNPVLGHLRVAELRRSHVEVLRNDLLIAQPAAVIDARIARLMEGSTLAGDKRTAYERDARRRFEGKPVGVHTVQKVLTTLVSILNFGIDEQIVRSNVAARVKKPSLRRVDSETGEANDERRVTEADILTTADFVKVVVTVDPHYRLLVRLAFLTGARQGEVLGLQWIDFCRAKGSLRIERQWRDGAFSPLKTASSRRTVFLDPETVKELIGWQLQRQKVHERDLIFATVEGKGIDAHNLLKRVWAPALRRAGLAYRKFHSLRHSCASLLLAAGEPVPSVSKQLGHASTRMTLDVYAHFVPSGRASGASVLAGKLAAEWKGSGKAPEDLVKGGVGKSLVLFGGRDRDRTCDPFHVKEVLYR
jgi:integrase